MANSYRKITINTDGGARGNPGPAACAFVARENGRVVCKKGFFLGETTNNVAEYSGIIEAYRWVLEGGKNVEEIVFEIDSELVVKQLNGFYRVKDKELIVLWNRVKDMEKKTNAKVFYVHVPRSKNKDADFLLNSVLDGLSIVSRHQKTSIT